MSKRHMGSKNWHRFTVFFNHNLSHAEPPKQSWLTRLRVMLSLKFLVLM